MRPAFTDVVGNRALCARLCADVTEKKLSHAYVIEGKRGFGKHMLAMRIAAAISCERAEDPASPLPCLGCPSCRKILSGNSPDIIFISKGEKATLGVEEIRRIRTDVLIPPNDTAAKIYIIEDAHLMTPQAQNAFLLTLEEPPAYVLFLLLCESTGALLETVRSRAPTLRTEPIPAAEITAYLKEHIPEAARTDPSELSEIVAVADGSIGRAIDLLDPKLYKPLLERRAAAREFVRLCSERTTAADALRFISSLPQKREELAEQCSEILYCLRDLLLCKQTENAPLCFFADAEEACALAYNFTTPSLLLLCEELRATLERLRQNANVRLTLTALGKCCGLL
ncbi:MAG: hypothetical protein E7643_07215 [Ruminococcaceae bacterium]|nr:hypothetical protein [Oscillospiraceae bacterium]